MEELNYIMELIEQKCNKSNTKNYVNIKKTKLRFEFENIIFVNKILSFLLEEYPDSKIVRTASGAIGRRSPRFSYDVHQVRNGEEITIVSKVYGSYRIQIITGSKELWKDEKEQKITGSKAFREFTKILEQFGINIEDYAIENGKEIKETIPKAYIKFGSKLQETRATSGHIYERAYHIDFHSSYMSGLVNMHPEFKEPVEYIYNKRKENNLVYKSILNMSFGYMQSRYKPVYYKYSHLSRDMIIDNNKRIDELTEELENNGYLVIAYNTDGIWYQDRLRKGAYHGNGEGNTLCTWSNDHKNCRLRFRSIGIYEFEEDGKYTPVVRGLIDYDRIQPDRTKWGWGDIFRGKEIVFTLARNGLIKYQGEIIDEDFDYRGLEQCQEVEEDS